MNPILILSLLLKDKKITAEEYIEKLKKILDGQNEKK